MERSDVEQIARLILRDYALPLKLNAVRFEHGGRCTLGFSNGDGAGSTVNVGVWCDAKTSPYFVREALKRELNVSD